MIQFYYNLSPNPAKVALALEEMELPYELIPIDHRRGQQFSAELRALNPNCKIPVIVDGDAVVFDSNAICLYLGEKTGKFMPAPGAKARGELLSWLMFIGTGLSPFSGQAVHFRHFSPVKEDEYAWKRYQFEAHRHYGVLDERLQGRRYILGDEYTIVDMAAWGWAARVPYIMGEGAWDLFPNVKRFNDEISARPAAVRAREVQAGPKHEFTMTTDDAVRKHVFRFLEWQDPLKK